MEYLKGILQIVRNTLALPFLFLGIASYFIAEFISGQYYTWRGDMAGTQAIINLRKEEMKNPHLFRRKGFRTPPKRR